MKTALYFVLLITLCMPAASAANPGEPAKSPALPTKVQDSAVTIESNGPYYLVTIDLRAAGSHFRAGQQYGRCIKKLVPDYESILGSYLWQLATFQGLWFNTVPERIELVKPQLEAVYREELDGLASQMERTTDWTAPQLVYGFNLIPDVFRKTQCNAFGAWGNASATGQCVAYRTLDWWGGLWKIRIPGIQAVTKLIYPDKTVWLIGALGHLGCITGINYNTGVMGAILDADVGTDYRAAGMRSYNFDLRTALENSATKEDIAAFLKDPAKAYAFDHLIFLADEKNCVILENNISGTGANPQRAVRTDASPLGDGIAWGHPQMIGAVNCFMLRGQPDNFSKGPHKAINTKRWALLLKRTAAKIDESPGGKVTPEGVRELMCSYWGKRPESLLTKHGDLYNSDTQQMMLYVPAERSLRVFFKPKDNSAPVDAGPVFVTVPLGR